MSGRRRTYPGRAGPLLVGLLAACLPSAADAHAVFMSFVRHDVSVTADSTNIDITIELTFHEIPSLAERRYMDGDHDGTIIPDEIERYLKDRADRFDEAILLRIGDRELPVIRLYEPQVDLLGVDTIAPSHHVLRLFYFARTPKNLDVDSDIIVAESLWSRSPAMGSLEVTGEDGIELYAEPGIDPFAKAKGDGSAHQLRARFTRVPDSANTRQPAENQKPDSIARATTEPASEDLPLWWIVPTLVLIVLTLARVGMTRRDITQTDTTEEEPK